MQKDLFCLDSKHGVGWGEVSGHEVDSHDRKGGYSSIQVDSSKQGSGSKQRGWVNTGVLVTLLYYYKVKV